MSAPIDETRRKIIQLASIIGLTCIISPIVKADELTDLVEADNQVVAVRVWPSSVYTRITIEASYAIQAKCNYTTDKLVVELLDAHLNTVLRTMPKKIIAADPIVKNIDVVQFNATTVRIVITLKQAIKMQTQTIQPVNLGSVNYEYRYVLDMYPVPQNGIDNGSLNDDILALLQLNSASDEITSLPVDTAGFSSLSQPALKRNRNLLIMIDPGHGGEDPGAIGPGGTLEKDVVLDIGKNLYEMINQSGNMQAALTRSQDIFIPLATRVAIARKARADVFVSIHADAFTTPMARGASVFVLSDSGASSSSAKWLAQSQNNADLIGGMTYRSQDKIINKVLLDMTQTWTLKKSILLGQILLPHLAEVGKLHNGKVEKAAFAVLKAPDIPSVLVETAFISNPDEEALLKQSEFRQKMAQMIFSGLNNFLRV